MRARFPEKSWENKTMNCGFNITPQQNPLGALQWILDFVKVSNYSRAHVYLAHDQ
jgi:hypothetical protein